MRSKIILLCLVVGCGYRLSGSAINLPKNIRTLSIPLFQNHSSQPAIEQVFTDAMIERFLSLPKIKITNKAQAVFIGTIKHYSYEKPLSFDRSLGVTEFQLEVVIDASIREVGTNKILWERKNIRKSTEFTAGSGLSAKNIAEDKALKKLAAELARRVFGLLEGF